VASRNVEMRRGTRHRRLTRARQDPSGVAPAMPSCITRVPTFADGFSAG
jgi:hypothetical protein